MTTDHATEPADRTTTRPAPAQPGGDRPPPRFVVHAPPSLFSPEISVDTELPDMFDLTMRSGRRARHTAAARDEPWPPDAAPSGAAGWLGVARLLAARLRRRYRRMHRVYQRQRALTRFFDL